MTRQTIYVAGYPKTGTTWLTWLLADVLDCPAGGSMPEEDRKELATEGQDRPGPYIVRKGHFVLMEGNFSTAVPTPHRMAPTAIKDERTVWIVRDPRDIAVSARHYFSNGIQTVSDMLGHMGRGTGPFRSFGPFNQFTTAWLDYNRLGLVRYEDLLDSPMTEIMRLIETMNLPMPSEEKIIAAIKRQAFSTKKKSMQSTKRPNAHIGRGLLRVGKKGQWLHEFSHTDCQQAAQLFNPLMVRLGYVENKDWAGPLPKVPVLPKRIPKAKQAAVETTRLIYVGLNVGDSVYHGMSTGGTPYVFGGNHKVGSVDVRDAPYLLTLKRKGLPLFKEYDA